MTTEAIAIPPPPREDFPYAKSPTLRVDTDGWEEQPLTMKIFWFGIFQLTCLSLGVGLCLFYLLYQLFRHNGIAVVVILTLGTFCYLFQKNPSEWIGKWIIALVVHQLDTLWVWIMLKGFSAKDNSIVHDGLPFGQDIALLRAQYNDQGHGLFIIYPCKDSKDSWLQSHHRQSFQYTWSSWNLRPSTEAEIREILKDKAALDDPSHAVVYLHGGGFVAANAAVLLQEAATMVRQGSVAVYALDYPLAPGQTFPVAIYSIMDSLLWLKNHRNISQVTMVGDSAGGSLAAYTTTLVTSPKLLAEFQKETQDCIAMRSYVYAKEDLPDIVCLASIYGVLDSMIQNPPLMTISRMEWMLAVHGLRFCLECYRNPRLDSTFPQHFCDLLEGDHNLSSLIDYERFPPTLFVCGIQDPLLYSTQRATRLLSRQKVDVRTHLFEARHAFVGFPRAWQGPNLRCQAAKADAIIGEFVRKSKNHNPTTQ